MDNYCIQGLIQIQRVHVPKYGFLAHVTDVISVGVPVRTIGLFVTSFGRFTVIVVHFISSDRIMFVIAAILCCVALQGVSAQECSTKPVVTGYTLADNETMSISGTFHGTEIRSVDCFWLRFCKQLCTLGGAFRLRAS